LSGCHSQLVDDAARQEVAAIRQDTVDQTMHATCDDGAAIGPTCGLVARRAAMQDFQDAFRAKRCDGDSGEQCGAKLDQAVEESMHQRYPLAAFRTIDANCNVHPETCKSPEQRELLLMASYNERLRALAGAKEHEVELDRRETQKAEENQRTHDYFLASMAAFSLVAP
jgi:hypothetical protein